jgi:hypothetical protein
LFRSFPADLPDRPSKLALRERISHKLKHRKGKQKESRIASSPVAPDTNYVPVTLPGSCARKSHVVGHVHTRRNTSQPAPRVLFKTRPQTQRSEFSQPGRDFSIVSLALPEPHIEYPTSAQSSSFDPVQSDEQGDVPRLHRKGPPQLTARDALAEQLGKLRLPHAPTSTQRPTSSSPTNFSLPLQISNPTKTIAAKAAWNRMAVSNPILPNFREESRSHPIQLEANRPRQGQTDREPIVIDHDSEHHANADSNRPTGNFQNVNFFQSGGLSRQSLNRRRARKERFSRKEPAYRSQSVDTSSSSSEGILTPDSSESSESSDFDFPARVAQVELEYPIRDSRPIRGQVPYYEYLRYELQERQDRVLAERLQYLEDRTHAATASRITKRPAIYAPQPAAARVPSSRGGRLASLRRAITSIGTRENPISIDSELDDPKPATPERARIQDYVALYGEPMDVDGASPFHEDARPKTANNHADERTHLRSRDCVVCGDSVHVVDLPSLANCDHRPETCADCYSGWIAAQLQGSSWREAKCPGNKCTTVLSYHEIRLYAQPETFQQYDTFIARAAFSEDRKLYHQSAHVLPPDNNTANFRWCRACDSGQIHMSGVEGNIFTCVACGHKVCIIHENTWHEGETCREFEYRSSGRKQRDKKAQEEASLRAIGKLTKKCPGPGCTWNIEKNDGCDHMTCTFRVPRDESFTNDVRFEMPL